VFLDEEVSSKGIPLQVCDVFLEELNDVDSQEISYVNLALLLDPFLKALASSSNVILKMRLKEKIFLPILENNIT